MSDERSDKGSAFSEFDGQLELARPARDGAGTGAGTGTGAGAGAGTGAGAGAGAGAGTGAGTGTGTGTAPRALGQRYQPLVAPARRRPILGRLFLLGLLGMGLYGGTYGYCRYQAADKSHAFSQEIQDLHQALLRQQKTIRPADVEAVVRAAAAAAEVQVPAGGVTVSIEPLSPSTMTKLPAIAQMGLGIAAAIPKHRSVRWVVGFRAQLVAVHGVARLPFEAERYTWLDDAQP